ncbi:MAG: hypothetical protein MK142_10640 [Pseudomonadales bacterium]|nr:hypothetical protein [Pseudomonadales bacterium]
MATKAKLTIDALSEWSPDGVTFTTIAESKTLAIPKEAVEYLDATTLDSTGGFKEKFPGLKDAGSFDLSCHYTPDVYGLAKGYQDAQTLVFFRSTMPLFEGQTTTGDVFEFRGFVSPGIDPTEPGQLLSMTLSVEVSGGLSRTPGA